MQVLTLHILRAGICGAHKCRILCKVLRPHYVQISCQYQLKRCNVNISRAPAPGPLLTMQQPDQVPGSVCRGEEEDPGQAQPAQEARGQGGGDGWHQRAPAGGSKHAEDGENISQYSVLIYLIGPSVYRCGARSWRPSPRGGRTSAPSATTPPGTSWTEQV